MGEGRAYPRASALGHNLSAVRALERAQSCASQPQTSHNNVYAAHEGSWKARC